MELCQVFQFFDADLQVKGLEGEGQILHTTQIIKHNAPVKTLIYDCFRNKDL